jgi:hypothetical protein
MRAKEFTILKEDDGDTSSSGNGGNTSGGTRGKLHQNHFDSIPDLKSYPDLPSHYYDMYRLGVHMAGSPDKQNMARLGPSGNEFVTSAFTDEDAAITNASRKAMGLKQRSISSKGSRESDDVHRVSPVAKRKTNKYGV